MYYLQLQSRMLVKFGLKFEITTSEFTATEMDMPQGFRVKIRDFGFIERS